MVKIRDVIDNMPAKNHEITDVTAKERSYGLYALICLIVSLVLIFTSFFMRFMNSETDFGLWILAVYALSAFAYMATFVYLGAAISSKDKKDTITIITFILTFVVAIVAFCVIGLASLLGI